MKNYIRFIEPEYFRLDPWQWDVLTARCNGYRTWQQIAEVLERSNPRKVREHLEKGMHQAQRWAAATRYRGPNRLRAYMEAREVAVDLATALQDPML